MAKPLTLEFQGEAINLQLDKVDRTKLYGYVDTEIHDENGKRCELGTLTSDGHSIVAKGGTALAYLSPDGLWRKKSELKPVDVNGKPITPVKSSFDAPIPLEKTATLDEFLSHNIALVYQLATDDDHTSLLESLKAGTIYQFPFSYRGGVEASAGFLLLGADGTLFLCVGVATAIEYVGLKATAAVIAEDVDAGTDDDDALDFSLV